MLQLFSHFMGHQPEIRTQGQHMMYWFLLRMRRTRLYKRDKNTLKLCSMSKKRCIWSWISHLSRRLKALLWLRLQIVWDGKRLCSWLTQRIQIRRCRGCSIDLVMGDSLRSSRIRCQNRASMLLYEHLIWVPRDSIIGINKEQEANSWSRHTRACSLS